MDSIETRVNVLELEVREINKYWQDINERLIRMEENLKNSRYNTVDFRTYNTATMELSNSVKTLTDKVNELIIQFDKQNDRINALEDSDGDKAKGILVWLVSTVGAIAIGYFIKGGIM